MACPCGKRLDLVDEPLPGMVDAYMGKFQWAKLTNAAGDQANWWFIKCPWCSRTRRGRESDLLELVRSAKDQGLARAFLP